MILDDEAAIHEALSSMPVTAVAAGLRSLVTEIPADDWDNNFLAAVFGPPGALRKAVAVHPAFYEDMGFRLWDTELLDIVAEVSGLGVSAFLLHWHSMQEPLALAESCARYLTAATGEPIAWTLPKARRVQEGAIDEVRAKAVAFLGSTIDEPTRAALSAAITECGFSQWHSEHHHMLGMGIRNSLRAAGFAESNLGVESLDDCWALLLAEALGVAAED